MGGVSITDLKEAIPQTEKVLRVSKIALDIHIIQSTVLGVDIFVDFFRNSKRTYFV